MSRRFLAYAAASLLASGTLLGLGATSAAAAATAPASLLTSGQPCARETPGPYLSPVRLNSAQAVTLRAAYTGDITGAEVDGEFEVWDVARDETRHQWRDKRPRG